jgi:RNA-directed DNA polymerase
MAGASRRNCARDSGDSRWSSSRRKRAWSGSGRFAHRDCKRFDRKRKPETFNFLGFTHACGVNRAGKFPVRRTTMQKRLAAKLHEVKAELRRRLDQPVLEQRPGFSRLSEVTSPTTPFRGTGRRWEAFRTQCTRLWYRTLRRRSQKTRLTWDRMTSIADAWLPPTRILHPWPEQRLAALIQGKSRMQ